MTETEAKRLVEGTRGRGLHSGLDGAGKGDIEMTETEAKRLVEALCSTAMTAADFKMPQVILLATYKRLDELKQQIISQLTRQT
jgi:hypothetical protein